MSRSIGLIARYYKSIQFWDMAAERKCGQSRCTCILGRVAAALNKFGEVVQEYLCCISNHFIRLVDCGEFLGFEESRRSFGWFVWYKSWLLLINAVS